MSSIITSRTGLKTMFPKMIYFYLYDDKRKTFNLKINLRISFELELLMPFDSLKLTCDSSM